MADEKATTQRVIVSHNAEADPAKRITELQFRQSPAEWLAQAGAGRQIIVVDNAASGRVTMVLGVNGVTFQIPQDTPTIALRPSGDEGKNAWLK